MDHPRALRTSAENSPPIAACVHSPADLQALMMIVALVLAAGFVVLVLLALHLCLVITFMQPLIRPPWWLRNLVIALSGALVFVMSYSIDGSVSISAGLGSATGAMRELARLSAKSSAHQQAVAQAAINLNASLIKTASCLGCFDVYNGTPVVPSNSTLHELCEGLALAPRLISEAAEMNRSIISAQAQGLRLANLVDISTGWHVGAAFLPLYAFTCTAAALFVGSIAGRRNLLLLAQFVAVIVWWMMCAVVSVEFAISVGFADACGSALDTTLHVLRTEALKGHDKPNPNDLWHYNLSAYYLAPWGCELKNPVTSSLLAIADNCQAAYDGLLSLPKVPSNCTAFSEKDRRVDLDQAIADVLGPLGGVEACGGKGVVAELFQSGAVDGLCGHVGIGFVQLWVWQLCTGGILILTSLVLPALWHSHNLPTAMWLHMLLNSRRSAPYVHRLPTSWREFQRQATSPAAWAAAAVACLRLVRAGAVAGATAASAVCRRCARSCVPASPARLLGRYSGHCDIQEPVEGEEALSRAANASSMRTPMLLPVWRSGEAPAPSWPPSAAPSGSPAPSRAPSGSPLVAPLSAATLAVLDSNHASTAIIVGAAPDGLRERSCTPNEGL